MDEETMAEETMAEEMMDAYEHSVEARRAHEAQCAQICAQMRQGMQQEYEGE